MSLIKYIERIQRINNLIHLRATGTPEEFADKLGIRRSTLFQSLQEMRELGVDIKYSWVQQSYYYGDNRRIIINVESTLTENQAIEETPEHYYIITIPSK